MKTKNIFVYMISLIMLSFSASVFSGVLTIDDVIKNQYIVQLKDREIIKKSLKLDVIDDEKLVYQVTQKIGVLPSQLKFTYNNVFLGFSATLSEEQVTKLKEYDFVELVEADKVVSNKTQQNYNFWNLDRIDTRVRAFDGKYNYELTGKGVHAYIIDTGIRETHSEFTGRIGNGYNAILGLSLSLGILGDCQGHGTHVAGTVGGKTWGVAKEVILHPVTVLTCAGNGTSSSIISGIDWVAKNAIFPAVANLSLGGGISQATDNAIEALVKKGVVAVVAAGNDNADACNYSPARAKSAITVASSDSLDRRSSFSNWGSCVDIFAPGTGIPSASYLTDNGSTQLSGTSMAAPHIAGAVAKILQANKTATPAQVESILKNKATPDVITDVKGSVNIFIYSND